MNNVLYKIDGNGKVASSKKAADVNGWYKDGDNYYYSSDGTFVVGQLKKIGAKWYGFSNTGVMYSNTTASIDGNLYGFDGSGYMVTGWYENSNGYYYYFGSDGKAYQGLKTIGSKKYYFNPSMAVSSKWTENGNLYVADKAGYVTVYSGADGWVNDRYYVANGKLVKEGWKKIDGKLYYFNTDGKMVTSQSVRKIEDGVEKYYLVGSNGRRVTKKGWHQTNYKYFDDYSGKAYTFKGWYYVYSDKSLATGIKKIGGKKYLFTNSGLLVRNDISNVFNPKTGQYALYAANKNGELFTKKGKTTFTHVETFRSSSSQSEYSVKITVYVTSGGKLYTGLKKISGKYYYFDPMMLTNCSRDVDGVRYFFGKNGACTKTLDVSAW